ncbi:unnamed protein product [Enterobius vermicularis]|uniref:Alpha-2-MRAP_C domain-containing protein n=1 Tax=Enterobius vermicularis TaxID=51028 RepID=A0A0N4VH60_ENTVE|nr:unnamed protein product [Enterobius vermicularis]
MTRMTEIGVLPNMVMLILLLCVSCITVNAKDGLPKSIITEENPFRTAKMNFIWLKATHHLTDKSVLKLVKKELDRFDGLYLSAKERSLKSGRNDMHEVDRKLEEAMKKFNLDEVVAAYNRKVKWKDQDGRRSSNTVLGSEKFAVKKLNKLWQAALSGTFTEYQLKTFRKELKDYEKKEEQYHALLQKFRTIPHENAVDDQDDSERAALNQQLKNISRELTNDYEKFHGKIFGTVKSSFRNEEVDALWRMAVLDSNFNESELESIRNELVHFDKHMDRLRYQEEELQSAKQVEGKKDVYEENLEEFEAEFLRLKRKLKRLEKQLETRIRHVEL